MLQHGIWMVTTDGKKTFDLGGVYLSGWGLL